MAPRAPLCLFMSETVIKTKKRKMSQIWQGDKVIPVTSLAVDAEKLEGLAPGDQIRITGVSKGHGFAGVVKRYRFAGGPKTHGQADRWRHAGSMGQTTTPGRVYKGKRMAGRMGMDKVSLRTTLLEIKDEGKTLVIKGPVPGSYGRAVLIRKI